MNFQVKKPAEAEKYRLEKIADAEKQRIVLEAEAKVRSGGKRNHVNITGTKTRLYKYLLNVFTGNLGVAHVFVWNYNVDKSCSHSQCNARLNHSYHMEQMIIELHVEDLYLKYTHALI